MEKWSHAYFFRFVSLEKKEKRGKTFGSWSVLNKTRQGQDERPHMAATDPEREAPYAESHWWSFRYGEKSRFTNWPVSMTPLNVSSLHRAGFGSQLWGREREERGQNQDRQAWRYYQVEWKTTGFMCFISKLLKRNSFIRNWKLGSTLESSTTFCVALIPLQSVHELWLKMEFGIKSTLLQLLGSHWELKLLKSYDLKLPDKLSLRWASVLMWCTTLKVDPTCWSNDRWGVMLQKC